MKFLLNIIVKISILFLILTLFTSCNGKGEITIPYDTPSIEICRFYIDYKDERNICAKSYLFQINKCWVLNK